MEVQSSQLLFHLVLFGLWTLGVHSNTWLDPPERSRQYDFWYKEYGGRLKFLTYLNGVSYECSFVYFSVFWVFSLFFSFLFSLLVFKFSK